MIIAIRDSATGWYKKGDKAEFIREITSLNNLLLIEIRIHGHKTTTIAVASNWA